MKEFLKKIRDGETLSEPDMIEVMRRIMSGEIEDTQIAAFLMGLSMRGESLDEICGAARVIREKSTKVIAPENAIDCCGTGGDHHGTYNISTAVAIVSAACGVPIAKHGNRASSSKSGAADVLEALGVNLNCTKEKLETALRKYNFAFLMAPNHHSAMKHVANVRKSIGIRTLFNMIGPLANPAQTKSQLIGVYSKNLLLPIAQTLQRLGTQNAWVVHGEDGLDEISISGKTFITILKNKEITEKTITPDDFSLPTHPIESIKGGAASENAIALQNLLNGEKSAYRDIVLANTSAVLNLNGHASSLKEGVAIAEKSIDSGAAKELLQNYISFTNES